MLIRRTKLACASLVLIALMACSSSDFITSFRVAFSASKPVIEQIAETGAISKAHMDAALADVDVSIEAAGRCQMCIANITAAGTQKKIEKAKCYYQLAQDLRAVLDNHHFQGDKRLDQISAIAEGVISALEEYSAAVNGAPAGKAGKSATRSDSGKTITVTGDPDKELERKMDGFATQLKALKQ